MAAQDLLRSKVDETPTIYAYTLPEVPKYRGLLKVGYTSRPGTIRIMEQGHELYLDKEIVLRTSAMRPDGTYFMDKGLGGVHYYLRKSHIPNPFGEWFRCDVKDYHLSAGTEDGLDEGAGADLQAYREDGLGGRPADAQGL